MSLERKTPFNVLEPLSPEDFREVYLETIFDAFKWDPQIGDTNVLSNHPILLDESHWAEISSAAEQLAIEAVAVEAEVVHRPELHKILGLPQQVIKCWRDPKKVHIGTSDDVRIIRFDFHYTTDGWKISEANIDTPGGWIEASGFARQLMLRYPGVRMAGDPPQMLAREIAKRVGTDAVVPLIHATAYAEDRAMMMYLDKFLEAEGLQGCLISPGQLSWKDSRAWIHTTWETREAAYLVRFFPADWLVNLPKDSGWTHYFTSCRVPASNPTSALIVQSKRFPLIWDRLQTPIPTWRKLLPETCSLKGKDGWIDEGWVIKPVLGRAGESIVIRGVTPQKEWEQTVLTARREHPFWIAQRRFETLPIDIQGSAWYPTIGVYTVGGKAAGVYARAARKPIVDESAEDIAVFLKTGEGDRDGREITV